MEKILLSVSYTDNTGKYWQDSYLKNKVVKHDTADSIHKTIAEAIKETDGVVLSYNGKPQTNVFVDDKDGNAVPVGYIYRGKSEIYDDKGTHTALFDVWATVKRVEDYPIENIEI